MSDESIRKNLEKAVKHLNAATDEIRKDYPSGSLFCECGESLHVMFEEDEGSAAERQKSVVFCVSGIRGMDVGAW